MTTPNEIWKPIQGYEHYSITPSGIIRKNETELIVKESLDKDGYCKVHLNVNGKQMRRMVHRLVALTFIPNPENKPYVDHIDNNQVNNSLGNLRWATASENMQNCKLLPTNTSGVKGVTYNKNGKKWRASISFEGKKIHIGSYVTIEEATIARQSTVNKLYGVFTNVCETL